MYHKHHMFMIKNSCYTCQRMLTSFLLIGQPDETTVKAEQLAQKALGENPLAHPDYISLPGPTTGQAQKSSIGIDAVRLLKHQLTLKPYQGEQKVAVIHAAHKLTIEAQHALLKLLEEPPGACSIILTTTSDALLLPTICSRSQLIFVTPTKHDALYDQALINQTREVLKTPLLSRLALASQIGTSADTLRTWLDQECHLWHAALLAKTTAPLQATGSLQPFTHIETAALVKLLHLLLFALRLSEKNVSSKLLADYLLLHFPHLPEN